MNPLNSTLLFAALSAVAINASSTGYVPGMLLKKLVSGASNATPSPASAVGFSFTRPLVCASTSSDAVFYNSLKEALNERKSAPAATPVVTPAEVVAKELVDGDVRYKLFDLLNCPDSIKRLSELNDDKINEIKALLTPETRAEFQLVLNRVHYGLLQIDIDRSFTTCLGKVKEVDVTCADPAKCTSAEVDGLLTKFTEATASCKYYFIKPELQKMLKAIKDTYNLSDSDASNDKALPATELKGILTGIVDGAPSFTGLRLELNKLAEDSAYQARSVLTKIVK